MAMLRLQGIESLRHWIKRLESGLAIAARVLNNTFWCYKQLQNMGCRHHTTARRIMVANGAAATLGPGLGMMSRLYFDYIIKELIILFYWLNGFVTSTTDSGRTVRMINALCMLTDTLEYLIDMIRSLITPSFMHIDVALLRPVPFWLELRLNWYQVFATWMANLYICPHIDFEVTLHLRFLDFCLQVFPYYWAWDLVEQALLQYTAIDFHSTLSFSSIAVWTRTRTGPRLVPPVSSTWPQWWNVWAETINLL